MIGYQGLVQSPGVITIELLKYRYIPDPDKTKHCEEDTYTHCDVQNLRHLSCDFRKISST